MPIFAILSLAISALLACASTGLLLRSSTVSKLLIAASTVSAVAATFAAAACIGNSKLTFWAFLFAAASAGCAASAGIRLFLRATRWIHRFVIYAGYAAVFAAMGIVALCLSSGNLSAMIATIALLLVYLLGSAGIFLAKTLTLRIAARTMPEYQASLNSVAGGGQAYW